MKVLRAESVPEGIRYTLHLDEHKVVAGQPDPAFVGVVTFGADMSEAAVRQELRYWGEQELRRRQPPVLPPTPRRARGVAGPTQRSLVGETL